MSGTDDHHRALLHQAAEEEAFLRRLHQANDAGPRGTKIQSAPVPAVSLMITNQQRAELRKRGFSGESIRLMTPAEAHAQLGLSNTNA